MLAICGAQIAAGGVVATRSNSMAKASLSVRPQVFGAQRPTKSLRLRGVACQAVAGKVRNVWY